MFDAATQYDRESFTLKAILLNDSGEAITYNTYEFNVFSDCEVEASDDVVIVPVLEPGVYEIAGEKVIVNPLFMLCL